MDNIIYYEKHIDKLKNSLIKNDFKDQKSLDRVNKLLYWRYKENEEK